MEGLQRGPSFTFLRDRTTHPIYALGLPPPHSIDTESLLRNTLKVLPASLRQTLPQFEKDLLSRESCLLASHSFWYVYCALLQDDSSVEQTALLRLMSQVNPCLLQMHRHELASFYLSWYPCSPCSRISRLGICTNIFTW